MKNWKYIGLTLLLVTGFIIPGCEDDGIDCDCSGLRYFDIIDLEVFHTNTERAYPDFEVFDTLSFEEYNGLYVDFVTDYHASIFPKELWSFSLMNTAEACSCVEGWEGSKEEMITHFSITTVNDFDNQHMAGASMVDLFDYQGSYHNFEDQDFGELLASLENELLMEEDMNLQLKKAPELDPELIFIVEMELSTGERYQAESSAVVILP